MSNKISEELNLPLTFIDEEYILNIIDEIDYVVDEEAIKHIDGHYYV